MWSLPRRKRTCRNRYKLTKEFWTAYYRVSWMTMKTLLPNCKRTVTNLSVRSSVWRSSEMKWALKYSSSSKLTMNCRRNSLNKVKQWMQPSQICNKTLMWCNTWLTVGSDTWTMPSRQSRRSSAAYLKAGSVTQKKYSTSPTFRSSDAS